MQYLSKRGFMTLQVGVKVLLKNQQNKYLLLKRNPEKYQGMATWDIVGGRIDPGSGLLENLKREVKEETGLTNLREIKLIAAQDILLADKHIVRLTYTGNAEGELVLSQEHTEGKWFNTEELISIKGDIDPYFKELLENKIISF